MIIAMKHDTVNGEVGISRQFSDAERSTADHFRESLVRDPTIIPSHPGADLPFLSFLAAYFLSSDRKVVGLTWVYVTTEVLRKTVCFTTLRLSLENSDPFEAARAIVGGALKKEIQAALKSRTYEIEVPDGAFGRGIPAEAEASAVTNPREMNVLTESTILTESPRSFTPFSTLDLGAKIGSSPERPIQRRAASSSLTVSLDKAPSPSIDTPTLHRPISADPPWRESRKWHKPSLLAAVVLVMAGVSFLGVRFFTPSRTQVSQSGSKGLPKIDDEDMTVIAAPLSRGGLLLVKDGPPKRLYGGEVSPNGSISYQLGVKPAPKTEYWPNPGNPIEAEGRKLMALKEDFPVHDLLATDAARPENGANKRDSKEEKREGDIFSIVNRRLSLPLSRIHGNNTIWHEVQFWQTLGGNGPFQYEERFDGRLTWPMNQSSRSLFWNDGKQYTMVGYSAACEARSPALTLPITKDGLEFTLNSLWLAGQSSDAYGLALLDEKDPQGKNLVFSVTRKGDARILYKQSRDSLQVLAGTGFQTTSGQPIRQTVQISQSGIKYTVGGVTVFDRKLPVEGLRRIGLVVCGKQAVSFQELAIQAGKGEAVEAKIGVQQAEAK